MSIFTGFSSPATVTIALVILPLLTFSYVLSGLVRLLLRQHVSPLRQLRGPPSPSFVMGNLAEMHDQENNGLVARWEAAYGSTFVYRGFVGGCRLMTTDPLAIAHILGHAYEYPKPDFVRDSLATMAAGHEGLIVVEGEQHRKQNAAFSTAQVKSLSPIFWQKATQLRDIWIHMAAPTETTSTHAPSSPLASDAPPTSSLTGPTPMGPSPPPTIDVLSWLTRATLDAIGLAGFGYHFDSLSPDTSNELADAFGVVFSTARKFRFMTIFQVWFPFLRRFRRNGEAERKAKETMERIGRGLIEERTARVMAELAEAEGKGIEKSTAIEGDKTMLGRDLLSVIIRASLSSSPSQRLSENETLCQISTFIAAGHETTSNALSWTLYALTRNPSAQRKLRAELRAFSAMPAAADGAPTPALLDALARLPYLENVVRESIRVHSPATSTMRTVARDTDAIPVRSPFVDRTGALRHSIPVRRHDIITLPLQAVNRSRALWGADADEFRPERWESAQETASVVPGLYAHTLSFLNGNPVNGNRACIGWKFALTEIKIFLYILLLDLEFSIDPEIVIEKKVNVVTRPSVKSAPHLGNQMPLQIRRLVRPRNPSTPP